MKPLAARQRSRQINESCDCTSLDRDALARSLHDSAGSAAVEDIWQSHPHLFSETPVYVARDAASEGPGPIVTSSRIGIARGIDRPNRFYVAGHPFVSPGEPSDRRVARKTHRRGGAVD